MELKQILGWLDRELDAGRFDDVSNNGLQVEASGEAVRVAFAVDASLGSVREAARRGAQLLVVHHGISWGGGIRRIEGGVGRVVRAAFEGGVSVAAYHLPLDASAKYGNSRLLARFLGLKGIEPAFSWRGCAVGVVGRNPQGVMVGVCSGGGGEFAEEAARLGCGLFVTGEASWGEMVAAENCGVEMVCAGHYETETFGVRALAAAMARGLRVETGFVGRGKGTWTATRG